MWRDHEPRAFDREQVERQQCGRGATSDPRDQAPQDIRDVFLRGLHVPTGAARERINIHGHQYDLRRSDVRTMATVGSFRVVPAHDLGTTPDRPGDVRHGDLWHLREHGLIACRPHTVGRSRVILVSLTERGRAVLEASRDSSSNTRQTFYAGLVKPKELSHDAQVFDAYARTAERLRSEGASIRRVVLDYELKAQYQRFLHRHQQPVDEPEYLETPEDWAAAHELPCVDGRVRFPDVRIEYECPDGRLAVEDVEVMTPHYRGAFAAAKTRTGFTRYRGSAMHRIGCRTTGRGGRGTDPRLAEEWLR